MKKKPCICKTSLISNIYSFLISVTFAISKIRSKGNQRQLSYSFKIKDVYRGEIVFIFGLRKHLAAYYCQKRYNLWHLFWNPWFSSTFISVTIGLNCELKGTPAWCHVSMCHVEANEHQPIRVRVYHHLTNHMPRNCLLNQTWHSVINVCMLCTSVNYDVRGPILNGMKLL